MSIVYPHEKVRERQYDVVLCCIFKNEAPYLREWIEYHMIVGVQHFFLYNNMSDDAFLEEINPYISAGIITLVEWPVSQGQMSAYADCVRQFADSAKWIGFIDVDEFVVPNEGETIYPILKKFERNRPAVIVNWRYFTSSGKIDRDEKNLVMEDFVVCSAFMEIGKCFFNTKYGFADGCRHNDSPHRRWGQYKGIFIPPVNLFDQVCLWDYNRLPNRVKKSDYMPMQINHYVIKSMKEFRRKIEKTDVKNRVNPHTVEYFFAHEMLAKRVDYSIFRFITKVKMNSIEREK